MAGLIEGDMQVRWTAGWRSVASGTLEGWCWNPAEPAARLSVEVLVDGVATVTATADRPRRDLELRGIGDGAHGFTIRLDPALAHGPERLVAARAAGTRIVGQLLVGRPEPPAADPGADALAAQLHAMSADIAALVARRARRPLPLAEHLGTLATVLRTGAHDDPPGCSDPAARTVASAPALLAAALGPTVQAVWPTISLALTRPTTDDAIALLRMMAPHHELLLGDDPADPQLALLASLTPAARIGTTRQARGAVLAVLDRPPASMAALEAALARLARHPDHVLIGAGEPIARRAAVEHWPVPAATGLRFAMASSLQAGVGDGALAVRAGRPCAVLVEPWPALA